MTGTKLVLVPDRFGLVVCDFDMLVEATGEGEDWDTAIEYAAMDTVVADATIAKVRQFNLTGDINVYWSQPEEAS